jgi:beta-lactamase regulating signal transducer with metallopeptidase domain/protein involved in polysaccharide export with SLBB domain
MIDILSNYASDSLIHAVGWALIHSLWQGTLIAGLLLLFLRVFQHASSNLRYVAGCASLVAAVGLIVLTCIYYAGKDELYQVPLAVTGPAVLPERVSINIAPPLSPESLVAIKLTTSPLDRIERYLPWMVLAWVSGMAIVSLRLLTGWASLRRMSCRGVSPISSALQARVSTLSHVMKVRQVVRVLESSRAVTPMVVGWVRPVILLPTASLTGLSPLQLEAVIAHELAHVLRYDYLVNLLQCVAETLLFYHPAVWWIGRVIRQERERCCDDLAVRITGDRVDYARALLQIAESAPPHRGRLSVASQGGDLSQRVRRLLGMPLPPHHERWPAGMWAALASLFLAAVLVVGVRAESEGEAGEDPRATVTEAATHTSSTDAESKTKKRIIEVPYQKLIDGDPAYNMVIRPGDVIRIMPAASFVYIGGEVGRSGAYNIPPGNSLTLKQLIVSAGGWPGDGSPKYAKLTRRLGPDTEETLHFSLDDIFDGWTQDAFLAPNDLIQISSEPGPEDEQAEQRRLYREQLSTLEAELANLHKQIESATDEDERGRRLIRSMKEKIKAVDQKMVKIKGQLRRDDMPVLMKIIPAPPDRWVGKPPRNEDLLVQPLPNMARSKDKVIVIASNYTDHSEQTTFTRLLDEGGALNLPGIGSVDFLGQPIRELEAEVLQKMKSQEAYSHTQRVTIRLPDRWTYTLVASDQTKARPGSHTIPGADFRLKELLMRQTDMPEGLRVVVIRGEPIVLTPTQP